VLATWHIRAHRKRSRGSPVVVMKARSPRKLIRRVASGGSRCAGEEGEGVPVTERDGDTTRQRSTGPRRTSDARVASAARESPSDLRRQTVVVMQPAEHG